MNEQEKAELLKKAKKLFREKLAPNHFSNIKKLGNIKNFKVNPFLHEYLTRLAYGDYTPENRARALIYPRALGTSITTSFGHFLQELTNELKESYASTTSGMDIEFIDAIDGRRKYCQLKAGPNTINKEDVKTIKDHFRDAINLAKTNKHAIASMDCIVGVCYGMRSDLNANYKKIDKDYPVYIGEEFWEHLTGDKHFYEELINAVCEVAIEFNEADVIEETVQRLAKNIEEMERATE